ncbi:MAG: hypothetical protein VZR27_08965 [Acutalibacteraceae bacterium]|nr:hypothetical protein [Acutalibacteraceae bacterium]
MERKKDNARVYICPVCFYGERNQTEPIRRIYKRLEKAKKEWITPPESERKPEGFVQLRTADGKTTTTINLTDSKDAYKAKQLVNFALGDNYSDEPYAFGSFSREE